MLHSLSGYWQTKVLRREDPYLKVGEVNDRAHKGASEYVWALKDINFKVEQGDVVGIIGHHSFFMKNYFQSPAETQQSLLERQKKTTKNRGTRQLVPQTTYRDNIDAVLTSKSIPSNTYQHHLECRGLHLVRI